MGQLEEGKVSGAGMIYQPRGGNNPDRTGGNCNLLWCGNECIAIDLGRHRTRPSPDGWVQEVADLRDLLNPESPHKLRAIFLSHAHWDHDEGIPRYLAAGFTLPPVYGSELTLNMLKEKLQLAHVPKARWPELCVRPPGRQIEIGPFTVEGVSMGHSLPGYGYLVKAGGVGAFFTSDFKMDSTMLTSRTDLPRLAEMGERGEVDALFIDGARVNHPGFTTPEAVVRETLKNVAEKHPHHRLNFIIHGVDAEAIVRASWVAKETSRFLVHHGASIKRTLRAMRKSGQGPEELTGAPNMVVTSGPTWLAKQMSASYVLNLLAGAQAEKSSVLNRASANDCKDFQFSAQDVVVLSGETMSWNQPRMHELFNRLRAQGVEHIYVDAPGESLYSSSAHEYAAGKQQLADLVKPKQVIVGVFGNHHQRDACREMFNAAGGPAVGMTIDNGTFLQIAPDGARLIGHEAVGTLPMLVRAILPRLIPPTPLQAA